jgi:hypothetical protein
MKKVSRSWPSGKQGLLDRRSLSNDFPLVKQFSFTDMGAMADMYFTGGAVFA